MELDILSGLELDILEADKLLVSGRFRIVLSGTISDIVLELLSSECKLVLLCEYILINGNTQNPMTELQQ